MPLKQATTVNSNNPYLTLGRNIPCTVPKFHQVLDDGAFQMKALQSNHLYFIHNDLETA